MEKINAVDLPSTDAMIGENLHRKEIMALERSKLRAKWIVVTGKNKPAELRPITGNGGRGKTGGHR